jgi:hypothetical protein
MTLPFPLYPTLRGHGGWTPEEIAAATTTTDPTPVVVHVGGPKHGDRGVHVSKPRLVNGRVLFSVDSDFPLDPEQCAEAVRVSLLYWKKKGKA